MSEREPFTPLQLADRVVADWRRPPKGLNYWPDGPIIVFSIKDGDKIIFVEVQVENGVVVQNENSPQIRIVEPDPKVNP